MSLDTGALISRVIDRAAQKCGQSLGNSAAALTDDQRAELMVESLASQLVGFLGLDTSSSPANPTGATDVERLCADQVARNEELARALGACSCWGELIACPACGGRGAAGWRKPEKTAFDRFVRPVVRRLMQHNVRVDRRAGQRAPGRPFQAQ